MAALNSLSDNFNFCVFVLTSVNCLFEQHFSLFFSKINDFQLYPVTWWTCGFYFNCLAHLLWLHVSRVHLAARTKHHEPGSTQTTKCLFLTVLEAGKSKIKELADSVSGEGPFPGSLMASSCSVFIGWEGQINLLGWFYNGTNSPPEISTSKTITLGVRIPTCKFWGCINIKPQHHASAVPVRKDECFPIVSRWDGVQGTHWTSTDICITSAGASGGLITAGWRWKKVRTPCKASVDTVLSGQGKGASLLLLTGPSLTMWDGMVGKGRLIISE